MSHLDSKDGLSGIMLNRFPAAYEHQSDFALFPFVQFRPPIFEASFESAQRATRIHVLELLFEGIEQL
jgi:hypothetical protein